MTMSVAEKSELPNWKHPAAVGYLIIALAFGGLGVWSFIARLDSAVVAQGVVTVESNRKSVQHLEGGIVREILVREGEHVEIDQLLFRLDHTQSQANADVARNQLAGYVAQEARLIAERGGADAITFPAELTQNIANPIVSDAIADQRKQFAERRISLDGQIAILGAKITQYEQEIAGLTEEKAATTRQLKLIDEELIDVRGLLAKGLMQKSRVLSLEREMNRLQGVIGRSVADTAKANNGIGEARLQIDQLRKKLLEEVNNSIVELRQKIAELREKVTISSDVLHRVEIRAPRAGVVQNLRVATIGGVIRPGESLLEISPDGDGLVVNAQISPMDINAVQMNMQAEVRFSSFHAQILPVIMGQITSVSHDRMTDDQTKQPYFLARVVVAEDQLPPQVRGRITAGMPADVLVPTGERSVINYLVRPLRNRVNKAFREL
jgi:HlyD family type I secretion membrane fusion protein